MSGIVTSVKYSISYISLLATRYLGITRSKIVNKAGKLVAPSFETAQIVVKAGHGTFDERFNADLVDSKGALSYPLVAYTYLVIRMKITKNCSSAMELYRYIKWLTSTEDANKLCVENGMIPLNDALRQRVARGRYCDQPSSYWVLQVYKFLLGAPGV